MPDYWYGFFFFLYVFLPRTTTTRNGKIWCVCASTLESKSSAAFTDIVVVCVSDIKKFLQVNNLRAKLYVLDADSRFFCGEPLDKPTFRYTVMCCCMTFREYTQHTYVYSYNLYPLSLFLDKGLATDCCKYLTTYPALLYSIAFLLSSVLFTMLLI